MNLPSQFTGPRIALVSGLASLVKQDIVSSLAALRRDGSFRQDLNELLCMPLTKRIASRWAISSASDSYANIR
jgi:hypothetical protein